MTSIMTAPAFPELEPLNPVSSGQPYPIDQLPPRMRNAAQAIAHYVKAPLPLAGNAVIAAAACLAQRLANAPTVHGDKGMPCSLFMLTLGNSGDRKSACRELAFKAIDEREKQRRKDHSAREAEIQRQADEMKAKDAAAFLRANVEPDPQSLFSDATFESIAGAFIRGASAGAWDTDEGGQVLGGHSLKSETRGATLGGLVKAFDAGRFERNRSKANAEGSGVAYNRRLTVSLLAQEITVREALTDPLLQGQGFLPRFLFSSAESLAGTRTLTTADLRANAWSDPRIQGYWARCRELLDKPLPTSAADPCELDPPVMPLADDALVAWLGFYNDTEREQGQGGDFCDLRPFASRAGELARRVAAVFACFEGLEAIDADTMNRACALVRFSLSEWARYAGRGATDPTAIKAQAVIDWLIKKGISTIDGPVIKRLGNEGPTRNRAKQRDAVIALLVKRCYLLPDGDLLRLNPLIHAGKGAETADTAEGRASPGSVSAEQMRNGAGRVRNMGEGCQSPAVVLHTSAEHPQTEKPAAADVPRNPHFPQRYEVEL